MARLKIYKLWSEVRNWFQISYNVRQWVAGSRISAVSTALIMGRQLEPMCDSGLASIPERILDDRARERLNTGQKRQREREISYVPWWYFRWNMFVTRETWVFKWGLRFSRRRVWRWLVFWVVAPCSLVEVYCRFTGACCLHYQGDEYRKHLWNIGELLPDYTAQQPRRQPSWAFKI
jgi:hypothetical protein